MTINATPAHIDAETLAAWAEHGLTADAASAVELHLSSCDRCQEVLAALVRSEPGAGAVILPFWTRRPVQWSAAGLAAAAALVAMTWTGRPPSAPSAESTVAQGVDSVAPSAQAAASSSSPSELRRDKPQASRQVEAKEESQRATPAPAAAPRPQPTAVGAPLHPVALMPPPVPPPTLPVAAPPVTVTASAPVVSLPVAAVPANAQMAAMSESVMKDAAGGIINIAVPDPSAGLASRPAASDTGRAAGRGGAAAGRFAAAESASPSRWRILGGMRIERTTDSGATWIALPIQPALTTPLVAGAATSPFVCWFVGVEGVVLLSTDGRTLRRVSLPESVVLTGVTALDGMRATVTAADGRRFSTADGGLTWKPAPPG